MEIRLLRAPLLILYSIMLLNRTVYLGEGRTQLCEYDTNKLSLKYLWFPVFIITAALNVFAIFANIIVIAACFTLKNRQALFVYIHALAFCDLFYALTAPFYSYM